MEVKSESEVNIAVSIYLNTLNITVSSSLPKGGLGVPPQVSRSKLHE